MIKKQIYGLVLFLAFGFWGCETSETENKKCVATTTWTYIKNSEKYEEKQVAYYDDNGYVYRTERINSESELESYETYKYDEHYNLTEYYESSEESYTYEYNEYGIKNIEVKNLNNELIERFVYTYEEGKIMKLERYDETDLDTTYLTFYSNGLLDSLSYKQPNKHSDDSKYIEFKQEFRYDTKGNLTERLFYHNSEDERMSLSYGFQYFYDEQNRLIRTEYLDENLEIVKYRYNLYNEFGNLTQTKELDTDNNFVAQYDVKYSGDCEKELHKPYPYVL